MKNLNAYISEGMHFKLTRDYKKPYNYYPQNIQELEKLIKELIEKRGYEADLNDIDTSEITDMAYLFRESKFNGDISNWNVSNVKTMEGMFVGSYFDGDLSKWDVSNVENMAWMFKFSNFTGKNGDISNWNISNVKNMKSIFKMCLILNYKMPKWYVNLQFKK